MPTQVYDRTMEVMKSAVRRRNLATRRNSPQSNAPPGQQGCVAAEQTVGSAAPQITRPGQRRGRWGRRIIGIIAGPSFRRRQQPVEIDLREAKHIEIDLGIITGV